MDPRLFFREVGLCVLPLAIGYGVGALGKDVVTKVSAYVQQSIAKIGNDTLNKCQSEGIKKRSELHGERFAKFAFGMGCAVSALLVASKFFQTTSSSYDLFCIQNKMAEVSDLNERLETAKKALSDMARNIKG